MAVDVAVRRDAVGVVGVACGGVLRRNPAALEAAGAACEAWKRVEASAAAYLD